MIRFVLFCAVLAVGMPPPCTGQSVPKSELPAETSCAVWPVPPDFRSRGGGDPESPAHDAPAADPFADPAEANTGKANKSARFGHVVPALGPSPPWNVRPMLESLGVVFREGDLALCSAETDRTPLLFVRAASDQLDLIETLISPMGSDLSWHGLITFTLQRRLADGSAESLVQRSLICQAGQRSRFQRHRGEKLVESEEVELTVGEDGATLDVNAAIEFTVDDRKITTTSQALLHSGDNAGLLLYTGPDKAKDTSLELHATAKVFRLPMVDGQSRPTETHWQRLAQAINTKLIALESAETTLDPWAELYFMPHLLSSAPNQASPSINAPTGECVEAKLPQYSIDALMDVRKKLAQLKVPLKDGDRAWYHPGTGILYVQSRERALAIIAGLAADQMYSVGINQMQITFSSWEEKPERANFAPRVTLVRCGQRSTSSTEATGQKPEKIEVEVFGDGRDGIADLNLALSSLNMGDETWDVTLQARTAADGTSPVTIASGMAKDSGGSVKHLAASSKLRWHQALELTRLPERKATAIRDIEAALKTAGR